MLAFVQDTFVDHVVSNNILFPGVGFVEIAAACIKATSQTALATVAILRPFILPAPGSDARIV